MFGGTGLSGLLGQSLSEKCAATGITIHPFDRNVFMVNDLSLAKNMLADAGIGTFVHCAANTNVEDCEKHPEQAYINNTLLTEQIARATSHLGINLVYISSVGIYGDHKESPYHEFDLVKPTTHHHRSKWLGELAVQQYHNEALIIRTGWLFGKTKNKAKNFIANRIKEAEIAINNQQELVANMDQYGNPTFASDVADVILHLIKTNSSGVFNVVNEEPCSRFDYVQHILKLAKRDIELTPVASSYFNRTAPVSHNEMATCLKLLQLHNVRMRSWRDSLEEFIMMSDYKS